MALFVEQIVNGLTLGAYYALIAVGLALVFGVARLVNFAHGEFFMIGGYDLYFAYAVYHLPYPLAIALSVLALAVFGAFFHRVVYAPVMHRLWHVQLIATLAASFILSNLAIIALGSTQRSVATPLVTEVLTVGGVHVAYQRLLVLGVAVVAFVALQQFIQRTRQGRAMRAIAQNREAAQVLGVDLAQVTLMTFMISAALTGLAAALAVPLYLVFPTVGSFLTLKAFAVVVIGGMGNVTGALIAAFIVGVAEALGAGYISVEYRDAIAFVLMIAVLLWRPLGLFARRVGI
jgi:branched-chain amino acid transport system permease protein